MSAETKSVKKAQAEQIERLLDRIEALEAEVKEANEYAARYDAVMETLDVDFEDMFPDWTVTP